MKRKNITLLNTISSLLYQLCLIASNFLIPKIILSYFGSEVNGLIATLNQFLSYISLVEGGITGVVMANLYKPLHDNDDKKINRIIKTTNDFYKKISLFYIGYTIVLATIYPLLNNGTFSYIYIFALTIILSISLLIQYTMSLTYRTLLNADKKVYVVSFTQIAITIFSLISAYISVKVYPSIHLLKLITGLLFVIQPLVFNKYVKRHYKIDNTATVDKNLLSSRWDGFAVNIAAFIHNCTDIVILSIFTDMQTVSIYSVYALVTTGLRSIIQSIARGITPTIGHSLASQNKNKLKKDFNLFEAIILSLIFIAFNVAILLITPFVTLYTQNINDANYYQPLFGVLILVSEICYLIREHHVSLAYSANKFKEITKPCFIEAALNIVVSLTLVGKFGLIGASIGTIVAMSFRSIYHVYLTKKIIGRSPLIFIKNILIFCAASAIGILLCSLLPFTQGTVFDWIISAAIYVAIFMILNIIIIAVFYKVEFEKLKSLLIKKGVKK